MFKKKNCKKCGEKINSKHNFCPTCGNKLNSNQEDWGMLGRNDSVGEDFMPSFFGGGMLNKMLGNAMKMLEKEMQKDMKKANPNTNFRLMINGKEIPLNQQPQKQTKVEKKETKKLPMFSEEKRKEFQKLVREEPKVNSKRFPEKLVYEIEIPGVNSVENISILRLEESIEIKAIGKKAYFKILQIDLPIMNYRIEKNKLVLELAEN